MVERFVYTEDVGGSSPSSPTIFTLYDPETRVEDHRRDFGVDRLPTAVQKIGGKPAGSANRADGSSGPVFLRIHFG